MAEIPLNKFRLVTAGLQQGDNIIYHETVKDVTAIVLSAQITNITSSNRIVSVSIERNEVVFFLLKDATVPGNDALNPLTGKLVLEVGDKLIFTADAAESFHSVLSILENAND